MGIMPPTLVFAGGVSPGVLKQAYEQREKSMGEECPTASLSVRNLGWQVTLAGLGVNLALGILYTWSVISKRVPDEWAVVAGR